MPLLEVPLHDDTVGVQGEHARVRHPVMPGCELDPEVRLLLLGMGVQQVELLDDLAPDVGQQRVTDAVLRREPAEYLYRVIADRADERRGGPRPLQRLLQLDQLRTTPRSPVRAAVEDHDCGTTRPVGMQIDLATVLVGQDDVRKPLADPGADA